MRYCESHFHYVSTSDTEMLKVRCVDLLISPIFSRPCGEAHCKPAPGDCLSVFRRYLGRRVGLSGSALDAASQPG